MSPENASTLGYVVLLAGIALAIIGYVIYLNIRGDKAGDSSEDSEDEAEISSDELETEDLDNDPAAQTAIVDQDSEEPKEERAEILKEDMESASTNDEEAVPTIVVPDEPELIPAATLLREGVSGRIVVKVGDRQYFDIESLKYSKDWSRVKSLSSDLADWIEDKPTSSALQGEREDTDLEPPSDSKTSDSDSMIVQINEIINKKVETMEGEEREIKLVEGAIGVLEVRVGVEKFPIDEVPYANVRELIQDAVSQWEKSQ